MANAPLSVEELIARIQQENAKSRSRTSSLVGRYFASFLGQHPETLDDISNDIIDKYLKQSGGDFVSGEETREGTGSPESSGEAEDSGGNDRGGQSAVSGETTGT